MSPAIFLLILGLLFGGYPAWGSISPLGEKILHRLEQRCLAYPWVKEIVPITAIRTIPDDAHSGSYYDAYFTGKVYVYVSVLEESNGELLHELWHSYWDKIAEESASFRGRNIRREFLQFVKYVEERQWDENFARGSIFHMLLGDWDSEMIAEELWGNAIEQVLGVVNQIGRLAATEAQAQTIWDQLHPATAKGMSIYLAPAYLKPSWSNGKSYRLPSRTASFVAKDMLMLTSQVSQWPVCFRQWERRYGQPRWENITQALIIASSQALSIALSSKTIPANILRTYLNELVHNYSPMQQKWEELGRPILQAADTGDHAYLISHDPNTITFGVRHVRLNQVRVFGVMVPVYDIDELSLITQVNKALHGFGQTKDRIE